MLWSLIKILAFVAAVGGLTWGASALLETSGGAQVTFGGIEITLSALQLAILGVVLFVAVWLLLRLFGLLVATVRFLNGDETAISRYFTRNRERRGFDALSDAMMALASGEAKVALAKAARAERYLERPELTSLLTAQAAEAAGDNHKAAETYKRLLQDERTRFVGVRGIMKQRLAEGETDVALKLAERAFAMRPGHVEVQDTLLQLQAGKADWSGARATLGAKLKHGTLPRDVYRRRDAVLALSEAEGIFAEGQSIEARESAIEANRLSPDLIPAAVMAARAYIENEKPRLATRVLKKAWDTQPHPDLAMCFAEIAPNELPEDRIKRFRQLTKGSPDHYESRLAMTELHIAAEDFPEARRAIGDLPTSDPTARVLTDLAAIERGEGAEDSVVRGLLTRALAAPRGPQWVCDNCQSPAAGWTPICENCGSFDTLSWRRPASDQSSELSGLVLLPGDDPEPADDVAIEGDVAELPADRD